MRRPPNCLVAIACLTMLAAAFVRADQPNTLTPAEQAEGWLLLFDGKTTFGWQAATDADWKVVDGAIRVTGGEPGLLNTTSQFGDFRLQIDFRTAAQTNSGVFLRTAPKPSDPAQDCYELNIAAPSVSPFFTGSFVGRQKARQVAASDDWNTFDVTAEAGHFIVKLNGETVLDYTDPAPIPRGHIGLQLNSGQVEFRNIKLLPLGLKSIFNGRDLAGWKVFPGKPSEFAVNDAGELTIKNGPGQLETEGEYADFILQLDVFVGGKSLNSGVFFRSIPGELWQGYEAQIQNGFGDGGRDQPVDCGTGGFYRRQNARRVVANDFEWFKLTVVVTGPHMAAWVNGFPVSDWTDTRPPHENPRKGLRVAPGTLQLQGHDPTTDLKFREIKVRELSAS